MNKPAKLADSHVAGGPCRPPNGRRASISPPSTGWSRIYGWDDVIYNHSSMRVPGEPRSFLMKRHELLYTEVTASNLVKVSMDEDLDEQSGVNRPGFTLHGGVLQARGDVNCAIHVHTEIGMAFARPEAAACAWCRSRRSASTSASAITPTKASPRISASASASTRISAQNRALIMHNHGLLTVGKTAREAFVLMKPFARSGQYPVEDGSDRRRADRNPARGLRQNRRAIRTSRRRPRLRRLGRVLCACSTRSTAATGTDYASCPSPTACKRSCARRSRRCAWRRGSRARPRSA